MHPNNLVEDRPRVVEIAYTNYRGEFRRYRVIPHGIVFSRNEHHPTEQWLMNATDVDRNVVRCFAMKDVASWTPVTGDAPKL